MLGQAGGVPDSSEREPFQEAQEPTGPRMQRGVSQSNGSSAGAAGRTSWQCRRPVATTGSLSAALVVFTKQLALAATKAAPIPVAPAPGFWSNILSMLGAGVVSLALPVGIVLSIIAMQWQLTSAKSEALIRRFDTARQQELTRMDTERKTDMARMDTERKADMASVKAEQARMDTERKTEQARMDTERKTEQARMLTELKDTLA